VSHWYKGRDTTNTPYLDMQNFSVNILAIWVAVEPPTKGVLIDWTINHCLAPTQFYYYKIIKYQNHTTHSLHKKMLETDSANPEAERLFMVVLSLIHRDNRLPIMRLFPKKNENSYRGWGLELGSIGPHLYTAATAAWESSHHATLSTCFAYWTTSAAK
jgi:hypothetical protein